MRPTRAALVELIARQSAISILSEPEDTPSPVSLAVPQNEPSDPVFDPGLARADRVRVELVLEGLTFDLEGLAPGAAADLPDIMHKFDLARHPAPYRFESLRLTPGRHLSGGERSIPILRGLIALARELLCLFEGVEAVAWPPAKSAIGRRFFESTTAAWLDGGAFPALGLIAFKETADGALQSLGLDYLIGQELRIEPPITDDTVAATRLALRLIDQLIIIGGITEAERVVAPDGDRLVMKQSRNGKFIRVWRE